MSVQNQNMNKTVEYLRQLGLSTDQINAYLHLLSRGPQTVLSLSRGLKTGRTKMYPLLEELAIKRLVVIRERHYGTSYEASNPQNLEFLVNGLETTSRKLRGELPTTLDSLKEIQQNSPSVSKIIEYAGLDGLKQMSWNLGDAKDEYLVFELPGTAKQLGKHFADKLQAFLEEKKLTGRILTNQKSSPNSYTCFIDPKIFKIEHHAYTYNNVVGLLSFNDNNVLGIEIYNKQLAAQQKQLFNFIWDQTANYSNGL